MRRERTKKELIWQIRHCKNKAEKSKYQVQLVDLEVSITRRDDMKLAIILINDKSAMNLMDKPQSYSEGFYTEGSVK